MSGRHLELFDGTERQEWTSKDDLIVNSTQRSHSSVSFQIRNWKASARWNTCPLFPFRSLEVEWQGEGSDGDLKEEFTLSIHTKQFSDIAAVTGRVLNNLKKNAIHFPAF